MKILFLDIDGVLNSEYSRNRLPICGFHSRIYSNQEFDKSEFNFEEHALNNLRKIVNEIDDLRIVISSNWRYGVEPEHFQKLFRMFGFDINDIELIDQEEENDFYKRSFLIIKYLNKYKSDLKNIKYIAVDDRKDLFHSDFKNILFTNPKIGLTTQDTQYILDSLK